MQLTLKHQLELDFQNKGIYMKSSVNLSEEGIRAQARKVGVTHFSTGVVVVKDKKILMVRRTEGDSLAGNFELPGGGVDEGESITEGAIRELKEETGLKATKVIATFNGFDYTTDRKPLARQINYIVEVEPGEVKLGPQEHDAFIWVDPSNLNNIKMTENMRICVQDALRSIA